MNRAAHISGVQYFHNLNNMNICSSQSLLIGPSSGLSLFSPQGLQWVAERTGTDELQGFIAELAKSRSPDTATKLTNLWIPTPSNSRFPFPPRELAGRYIRRKSFSTNVLSLH
jgi:hypothetical protein